MEKLCAAALAAVSVMLMYLLLRRNAVRSCALLLSLAYAFGTNTWMISSQALWQHGAAQLFLLGALLILSGTCTGKRALMVGLLCGLSACNRPPNFFLALPLGLCALFWAKTQWWKVAAGAIAPLIPLLAYNHFVVGEWLGGYARKGDIDTFQFGLLRGLQGLLLSPARGLFVFSPFLLFLPLGIKSPLTDLKYQRLNRLITAGLLLQLLFYAKLDWRAGAAWGPRWLTDAVPLMIWMLAPVFARMGRSVRILFILSVIFSVGVQTVGAFWYAGASDTMLLAENGDPGRMPVLWNFRNTPYLVELTHPPAPRGLFSSVDGNIDRLTGDGVTLDEITVGSDVTVEGWTLTHLQTPDSVTLCLGPVWGARAPVHFPVVQTNDFFIRPDVSDTMKTGSASGWRVTLQTGGFPPGEYVLLLNAKSHRLGEFRPVTRRRIRLISAGTRQIADLEKSAETARSQLIARQQPEGYWLTCHTRTEQYRHPLKEMNTFLGAMMIDLLHPVADEAGLTAVIALARNHLLTQIESNGLTRYHGRPDSTAIPALGAVITPDADDTALAWRIAAPDNRTQQQEVLRFLQTYRTREGLYQTWLAPVEEYISIDPGRDPNPADLTIQMHVLMWLAQIDPPAADALFDAVRRNVDRDDHWVYYRKAPMIPILRQADLHELGYPLSLPAARLQQTVPGQEPWMEALRLLLLEHPDADAVSAAGELLSGISKNQFGELQRNPPLLYHNDFSARVSRFYWSEDFGYALWLRIYHKYRHALTESSSP